MADLKVTFAGLELKNPLMLAPQPGWDGQRLKCRPGGFWRCNQ